jgi:HAD superfamily hydrolase (TIGR01549 family)
MYAGITAEEIAMNVEALGPVRGVIFDLDGTLADSRLDFAAMREETGCPQDIGLLEFHAGLEDFALRQQVDQVIRWHELSGAGRATWMPGARELLAELEQRNIRIGIFTRNSRESASNMLVRLGMPCDDLIAREDAPVKPDPAGLKLLAERWQLAVDKLLMIGDFRYDLEAARSAGIASCLYAPGGDSPFAELADMVIESYEEIAGKIGCD